MSFTDMGLHDKITKISNWDLFQLIYIYIAEDREVGKKKKQFQSMKLSQDQGQIVDKW